MPSATRAGEAIYPAAVAGSLSRPAGSSGPAGTSPRLIEGDGGGVQDSPSRLLTVAQRFDTRCAVYGWINTSGGVAASCQAVDVHVGVIG